MSIELRLRKARSLGKSGNLEAALSLTSDIVAEFPANTKARKEIARIRKAMRDANDPPSEQQQELADICRPGRYIEALALAKSLIARYPRSTYLWPLIGTLCLSFKEAETAEQCFRNSLSHGDRSAKTFSGLGMALGMQGRIKEAIVAMDMALEREPANIMALQYRGSFYFELTCYDVALEAYEKLRRLVPGDQRILRDLAKTLFHVNRRAEAHAVIGEILEKHKGTHEDYILAADIAIRQRDYCAALDWFERIEEADGNDTKILGAAKCRQEVADWSDFHNYPRYAVTLGRQDRKLSCGPILSFVDDPFLQRTHAERVTANNFPIPATSTFLPRTNRPERLRIGYFSADFENHATIVLMGGMLAAHDRERFEIFAYSYGVDTDDAARQKVEESVDHFREVRKMTDAEIAAAARDDKIDIAIDLKGFTEGTRSAVFAQRMAPVQVAWLGWPGTMGHDCFDYAVVDRTTVPDSYRASFSENLIYMPDTYQPNDHLRSVPEPASPRKAYGLPEDAFVFCCFSVTYKITPVEFDIWMRLLDAIEGSVLWLLGDTEAAESNLRREAEARSISPDRLIFGQRLQESAHLARHGAADLFLDTFTINAHTTCSDALWAGLPVVTMPGRQFAARVAASLLKAVGLPELIASDQADYERIALDLARNPGRLSDLKARLSSARTTAPLFDTHRFARHLEDAFDIAFDRHLRGEAPADFDVPARRKGSDILEIAS